MANFILKHGAQGLDNGFGLFLSCEPRDGWLEAMSEAMDREYAGRHERSADGKVIQYEVIGEMIENQEQFDAYKRARMMLPVVNVYD